MTVQYAAVVPLTTLIIHQRVSRRKFPITHPSSITPRYYILSPPSWAFVKKSKSSPPHSKEWLAVIYAGSNPKYAEAGTSPIVGLVRRSTWWKRLSHTIGGDVAGDVLEVERTAAYEKNEKANFWRKLFCSAPKEFIWEGGTSGAGRIEGADRRVECLMTHAGHRRYTVNVDGVEYTLTGTRRYGGTGKGCNRCVKLVRSGDGVLVAAFNKTSGGEKGAGEECQKKFGEFEIFEQLGKEGGLQEQLIVQLLWSMVEAEHMKREIVWDIIKEITDNAEG